MPPRSLPQQSAALSPEFSSGGGRGVDQRSQLGDLFMSLIHTAELCGANPFGYLTELQTPAGELANNPAEWMPWNYREALDQIGAVVDSG